MNGRKKISFGTAGWRGIISDDFTFDGVRLVSQAIADLLKEESGEPSAVTGYDTRFLSEEFARAASEVLAANGVKVIYSREDAPTPVISDYIIRKGLSGGINITASHNPPEYSGIKFSPSWGGPALPETTDRIEESCLKLQDNPEKIKRMEFERALKEGLIETADIYPEYEESLRQKVDTGLISGISVAFDCMYGTARKYIPRILDGGKLKLINSRRDVLFGGHHPEPAAEFLGSLIREVSSGGFDIGVAVDGDADRFGIIDSDGTFITPNQVLGLALYHLHRKGLRGAAVRSVMTSSFIDGVAGLLGVELIETPVGFKYIGDIFVKRDIIVGGEESGGLTTGGHLPEKDGILACLIMAELRAYEKRPLLALLDELQEKTGRYVTVRKNYKLSPEDMERVRERMRKDLPEDFGGVKVEEVITTDGYKFMLSEKNSWIGFRFSGTEPVVRLYAESTSDEKVAGIIRSAEKIFSLS